MVIREFILSLILLAVLPITALNQVLGENYSVEIRLHKNQTVESLKELIPYLQIEKSDGDLFKANVSADEIPFLKNEVPYLKILSYPIAKSSLKRELRSVVGAIKPEIQAMIDSVSIDTLRTTILSLQNYGTRYEYTPAQDSAGVFIYNQFIQWGLEAEYDTYTFGTTTIYDIDLTDENASYLVGTKGMIVKSTDGGVSWLTLESSTSTEFYGVDFISSSTGWVVGQGGMIKKTTDGGTTWLSENSGQIVSLYDVSFIDDQIGLVVGENGKILKTTDSGTTWTTNLSGTTQTLREVTFVTPLKAWTVGMNGTVLQTTDGGTTWSYQYLSPSTTDYLRAVYFIDSLNGWIAGEGRHIYRTTDGGSSWNQKLPPPHIGSTLRGVYFANYLNGWIVDYEGRILNTTDGGENWSIQLNRTSSREGLNNIRGRNSGDIITVGTYGNLLKSTNAGTDWIPLTSSLPAEFKHNTFNIIATIPGLLTPQNECVMVAHYDSYSGLMYTQAPGANDNGTGTAAIMESARLCKVFNFENTIKFVIVSGEEIGTLGSDHYAFQAKAEGRNIVCAINGDMIGYPTSADTNTLIAESFKTRNRLVDSALVFNARYSLGITLRDIVNSLSASDHGPFTIAGYDALNVSEATAQEIWGGADPYYHSANDTYDKLRPGLIRKGTQLMLATVAELAKPISLGSISGSVLYDVARDSIISGDVGLSGFVLKLYRDGQLHNRIVSNVDGNFSFPDIFPGTYTLEESLATGWIQTIPRRDDSGVTNLTYGTAAGPRAYLVTVDYGSIIFGKYFGNYYYFNGSISGTKFNDLNNNGNKNVGEPGMADWKIYLDGKTLDSVLTDITGLYKFNGLDSGYYEIYEEERPGWRRTHPVSGSYSVTISSYGENITDKDFGNYDGNILTKSFHVTDGWNLLSLPLIVSDPRKEVVYQTSISSSFIYANTYVVEDTITPGYGFWIKFDSPQDIQISGYPFTNVTINVTTGWNIIGTISQSIFASHVRSIPDGIITSPFYEYKDPYHAVDTLRPGFGYWVKVDQPGMLFLSLSNQVSINNRVENSESIELPPPPPEERTMNVEPSLTQDYILEQNYPNPFNPQTLIRYYLPHDGWVSIKIYNMIGEEIEAIVDEYQNSGYKSVKFDAGNHASGIYTCRMISNANIKAIKLLLIK